MIFICPRLRENGKTDTETFEKRVVTIQLHQKRKAHANLLFRFFSLQILKFNISHVFKSRSLPQQLLHSDTLRLELPVTINASTGIFIKA